MIRTDVTDDVSIQVSISTSDIAERLDCSFRLVSDTSNIWLITKNPSDPTNIRIPTT